MPEQLYNLAKQYLLCLLGGLFAALLVGLFRSLIDSQHLWLLGRFDDFSQLAPTYRILMPLAAVPLLLLLGRWLKLRQVRIGIPLVIERIRRSHGVLPWRNTVHQFIGGYLALSSGFSVGREGPIVHLGAAASAWMANHMRIDAETARLLCASGVATAISVVFATPLAAVAFVMEVIVGQWRWRWLLPLLLVVFQARWLDGHLLGNHSEISVWSQHIEVLDSSHWLLLILFGLLCGALGRLFNGLLLTIIPRFAPWPARHRFMLAALLTALLGSLMPYAMGTLSGIYSLYQTAPDLSWLLLALLCKLTLVLAALGLGIPGGVVGPLYALGLLLGLCVAQALGQLGLSMPLASLAVLGLAGVSAASLQAPIAAVLTLIELTGLWSLWPQALLVVVPACWLHRLLQGTPLFIGQLAIQGVPAETLHPSHTGPARRDTQAS